MSTTTDFDRVARAWLDEGPTQLSDRALEAALADIHLTQQRRALRVPWRFPSMPALSRATGIAAVALVAVVGAVALAYLNSSSAGGQPTAPPSTGTAAPSAAPATTPPLVVEFSSPAFGYDARYPAGWTAAYGTTRGSAADIAIAESETSPAKYWDHFKPVRDTNAGPRLVATSAVLPGGMTEDQWIAAYQAPQVEQAGRPCIPERSTWDSVSIDGRTGGIYVGCGFAEAMVFDDGTVFIFSYLNLSGSRSVVQSTGRALLEAFVGSVSLHPERAAQGVPAASAATAAPGS